MTKILSFKKSLFGRALQEVVTETRQEAGLTPEELEDRVVHPRFQRGELDVYAPLGKAIVDARQKAGLRQEELASRLNHSPDWVGKVEAGRERLEFFEFCEIAEALDISPEKLFEQMPTRAVDRSLNTE